MAPAPEPYQMSPMGKVLERSAEALCERDHHAWPNDQAARLRARSRNDVDRDNPAGEVESLGRRRKREIRSRPGRLVQHLPEWQFRPGRRGESRRATISEQRLLSERIIEDGPSPKRFPAEVFPDEYARGRREAIDETGLPASALPDQPPFTIEQAPGWRFLPGKPFGQWMVIRD